MSPVVAGSCSIISAKCVCDAKEKKLQKAWDSISSTRDTGDEALSGS